MPDIKNATDYAQYQADVTTFIEREHIKHLSTSCRDSADFENPDAPEGEPWFSWRPCECCKSGLGGMREYLYALDGQGGMVQFTICEDCVYYVNYGRLDDQTMQRVAQ